MGMQEASARSVATCAGISQTPPAVAGAKHPMFLRLSAHPPAASWAAGEYLASANKAFTGSVRML
jgi:hypothetical protein